MKYVVKTVSSFENVYVIDAATKDDAIERVMNTHTPPDFYQKHLGEKVTCIEPVTMTETQCIKRIREQGYF